MIKTESQKIRESIKLSDASIIGWARQSGIRYTVDPVGAPDMSYADWAYLANQIRKIYLDGRVDS